MRFSMTFVNCATIMSTCYLVYFIFNTIHPENQFSFQKQKIKIEKYEVVKQHESNKTVDKKISQIKNNFDKIYKNLLWGDFGGGSGFGSTINYTESARDILLRVMRKYAIKSMLDAPCGSFIWMPIFLKTADEELEPKGEQFRYHGVDVVESVINTSKARYSNEKNWNFSVCDFSQEDLPNGYDLIFSRDALQHLSYEKIFFSLRAYSRVKGAKYLLVGSYLKEGWKNKNIQVGEYFSINLKEPPFNLNQYVEIFKEEVNDTVQKSLILYDIPNYLSQIDFGQLGKNLGLNFVF